jgi:hypothetical protein
MLIMILSIWVQCSFTAHFLLIKLIWTRVFSPYMVQTSSNRIWYHLCPRQETIDEPSNRKHPMFSFILQKTVIIFNYFFYFHSLARP